MKKYKLIFIFTILLCLFFNLSINYSKHKELPSEGWSRNFEINKYMVNDHNSTSYEKRYDSIKIHNDIPYYLYVENQEIFLKKFDKDFNLIDEVISFTVDNNTTHYLDLNIVSENNIYIYILDNKKNLSTYHFDGNKITKNDINIDVSSFKISKNNLYYVQSGDLYKNNELFRKDISTKFDVLEELENTFILFIDKSSTNNDINVYSKESNSVENIYSLPKTPNISIKHIYINGYEEKITAFIQLSNTNNSETTIKAFSFDKYFPGNIEKIMDEKIYCYNNSLNISNGDILVSDVDNNFGGYPNLFIGNILDKSNKRLSISKKIKFNIDYFNIGELNYVKWDEFDNDSVVSNIASNNKNIIEKSLKIDSSKLIDIVLNSLSSYLPLFYLILIPFTAFFIPVIIFVMIMSMFNLGKLENNVGKTLTFILVVHNLSKLVFFVRNVILNKDFILSLPVFLQSYLFVIGIFIILLLLGIIFIRTLRREEENFHFFKYYIYYMIFDILSFSMILYSNFI